MPRSTNLHPSMTHLLLPILQEVIQCIIFHVDATSKPSCHIRVQHWITGSPVSSRCLVVRSQIITTVTLCPSIPLHPLLPSKDSLFQQLLSTRPTCQKRLQALSDQLLLIHHACLALKSWHGKKGTALKTWTEHVPHDGDRSAASKIIELNSQIPYL